MFGFFFEAIPAVQCIYCVRRGAHNSIPLPSGLKIKIKSEIRH